MPAAYVHFSIAPDHIFHDYASQAARAAALFPLTGNKSPSVAYRNLNDMWRARLHALAVARMLPWANSTDRRHAYAANCPPFGVKIDHLRKEFTEYCQHARFCPMCYARRFIIPTFNAFDFFLSTRPKSRVDTTFDLLLVEVVANLPADANAARSSAVEYAARLAEVVKEHKVLGGVQDFVVVPRKDSQACLGRFRGLLVPPQNLTVDALRQAIEAAMGDGGESGTVQEVAVESFAAPLRHQLAKLIGAIFRYPTALMTGDLAITAGLVHRQPGEKIRAVRFVGCIAASRTLAKTWRAIDPSRAADQAPDDDDEE